MLASFFLAGCAGSSGSTDIKDGFVALDTLSDWNLDGNGAWEIKRETLRLFAAGVPDSEIRRPAALAILDQPEIAGFTLEAEIRSTAPPGVIRADALLIFGYRSPEEFYYLHLSGITDDVHNGSFIVNRADRKRLDDGDFDAFLTDRQWHHVKLVRNGDSGAFKLFMDHAPVPALEGRDSTFLEGKIGFGSFDDTAEFRKISISPDSE